jgi:hypothetical protein
MLFANEREIVKGLLSDPPIFIGEDGISLDTGSPYQTPSRKDLEEEMKPGAGGPPADFDINDFLTPVKKADASDAFSDNKIITKGGGGKKGFLGLGGKYPEWTNVYDKNTGISTTTTEGYGTTTHSPISGGLRQTPYGLFNEGTGIEKGGYENAPQWLRDQMWKQDLRRRQELGLEPVAY